MVLLCNFPFGRKIKRLMKCSLKFEILNRSARHLSLQYIGKMVLLVNDEFLVELSKMFQRARVAGSVTMTMKRYDGRTQPDPRDGKPAVPDPEYKCLLRATSGSKKITTVVEQREVDRFTAAYSNLLKTSVNGLKRLKKQKNKTKATQ